MAVTPEVGRRRGSTVPGPLGVFHGRAGIFRPRAKDTPGSLAPRCRRPDRAGWGLRSKGTAQADLRDITQPIPVVNSGGHTAPVRSLIFASRDGSQLLSAGMDKIINVWNLNEAPPGLARTIRPRIWRGYAGAIYAMALSPKPDRDGQRTLAVAGFGVQNTGGEIGLFRFPGLNSRPTGDVQGQLPSGGLAEKEPQGHLDSVTCLAFDPRGGFLCSGSIDTTARIWDLRTRRTVAVLKGHTRAINALAYSPDGRRLVTAGADGFVMLWDVDRRVRLRVARPDPRRQLAGDPEADAINALAFSPDGRWVVIGRENGDLIRYDAADLGNATLLPRGDNRPGCRRGPGDQPRRHEARDERRQPGPGRARGASPRGVRYRAPHDARRRGAIPAGPLLQPRLCLRLQPRQPAIGIRGGRQPGHHRDEPRRIRTVRRSSSRGRGAASGTSASAGTARRSASRGDGPTGPSHRRSTRTST